MIDNRIEKFWSIQANEYRESAAVTSGYLAPIAIPDVRIDVAAVLAHR